MRIQASAAPSQHLPIRNSLSVNTERVRRLEAEHNGEADFTGSPEVVEGRAEHWESGTARTTDIVQIKQRRVLEESKGFCFGSEKEDGMMFLWRREVYIFGKN